ncbi:MAG: hypothetical protein ACKO2T_11045 [Microcystis aeruginosa]
MHGAFPKSERFVAGLALGNAPYGDSDRTPDPQKAIALGVPIPSNGSFKV